LATLLVPVVAGVLLAASFGVWYSVVAIGVCILGMVAIGLTALRDAREAAGTAALDYLLLLAGSRDGPGTARTRAERYLTASPATRQDHDNLLALIAGAHWLDEPRWDIGWSQQREELVPAVVDMTDRRGNLARLNVAIRLTRDGDRRWRVSRIWTEQTTSGIDHEFPHATPLPVAW
jgi:hypothetical protein